MIVLNWLKRRREKKILDALALQLNDPKSSVSQRVDMKANLMAALWAMRWLDAKRIHHCAVCPSTDSLRRVGDKMYCPTHSSKVAVHA